MVLFGFFCQLQPLTSCPINCLFSKGRWVFPTWVHHVQVFADAAVRPTGDALCFQRAGCSYLEPSWRYSASSCFSSSLASLQLSENLKKSRKFCIIRILKSSVQQVWFRFVGGFLVCLFVFLLIREISQDKKVHIN